MMITQFYLVILESEFYKLSTSYPINFYERYIYYFFSITPSPINTNMIFLLSLLFYLSFFTHFPSLLQFQVNNTFNNH